MNYFKNPETNQVYAYDDEQVKSGIVRKELVKMTKKEIDAHINPVVTAEQLIEQAEAQKQYLIAEAATTIAPLQYAVDLDIATPKEISALKEWKTYRVMLNRVDTSLGADVVWPTRPA